MKEQDDIVTALAKRYGLDESSAHSVIEYAKSLSESGRKSKDFALAKALNERVTSIINTVADAYRNNHSVASEIDIKSLNKVYVLLVNELKRIYLCNKELSELSPEPTWKYFEIIEGAEWEIKEYIYQFQGDQGKSHNAQVNKLCIIAGYDSPEYTDKLKDLVEDTDKAIESYKKTLRNDIEIYNSLFTEKDWLIPSYELSYSLNGNLTINRVLKLKRVNSGSVADKLIAQALNNPNVAFKPELGKTSRNLSTTLSSMGFTKEIRLIFFPVVSKNKGIVFRQYVTRETIDAENINTSVLDQRLKDAGAKTESTDYVPF